MFPDESARPQPVRRYPVCVSRIQTVPDAKNNAFLGGFEAAAATLADEALDGPSRL